MATVADGSTKIVGVALGNAATGEAVTAVSLVIGQQFKVVAGEAVTKGDQLGLKVSGGSGQFFKAGPDTITPYRVAALDNADAGDLVQVVCFETIAFKDLGGGGFDVSTLYATDENDIPAVGSMAIYQITGVGSTDIKYGSEFTSDGSNVIVANLGLDGNNMVKESGGTARKKLPSDAKIVALSCHLSGSGISNAIILGLRIA